MSTSFWLDRSKINNTSIGPSVKNYDVVIIGAGIAGLSTAYWLNKEDESLRIAIVEKSRVGFGASGRNAGFITCGSVEHFSRLNHKYGPEGAGEIWRFSEKNLELLRSHIIGDDADSISFQQNGTYSLASTEPEVLELGETAKMMEKLKISVKAIDAGEIEKNLGVVGFLGGIKYIDDATVNPKALLDKIQSLVTADLFEGTEAYAVEVNGDTRVVRTDLCSFEAPMVVSCLNGYSASLFPYFREKIYPTRGQILVTESLPPIMDGACYANFYLDYFRQLKGGEILIGGFRQLEKATEVGYSDHTTELIQKNLEEFVRQHIPHLREKRITHRWGGVMGFSVDGQPLVGALPEDPQVMFHGGFTGHGLGLAFHTAKCLVDAMYGREIPNFLSAKRF